MNLYLGFFHGIEADPAYGSANQTPKIAASLGMKRSVFSLPMAIYQDGVIDSALLFKNSDGGHASDGDVLP